jgi:hypothetical protein
MSEAVVRAQETSWKVGQEISPRASRAEGLLRDHRSIFRTPVGGGS